MKKLLFIALSVIPLLASAQYKLRGTIRDSLTHTVFPGATVVLSESNQTNSDVNGEFEIESLTPTAQLKISFIGYVTQVVSVNTYQPVTIQLAIDEESLKESNRFIKTGLSAGYYGDLNYAPTGFIVSYSLQSVGKTDIDANVNYKYWRSQANSGYDISLGKSLFENIKFLPHYFFTSYKSIDYPEADLAFDQARILAVNALPHFFGLDIGAAYTKSREALESGPATENYFSGVVGLTKVLNYLGPLSNFGFYTSVAFDKNHTNFEAGTYKGIGIKNTVYLVVMAKYYHLYDTKGFMVSLRFSLFDTRYYCCIAMPAYYDYINPLR